MANVLAIPDLHEPWSHPDALRFCKELFFKYNIDVVVFLGDELDHHSLSNYTKNPDLPSAKDEFLLGMSKMQEWYKAFPKAFVMKSNHGARPFRKALDIGLPSQYLKDYKEFMQAPEEWEWLDEIYIDNVRYSHGESCKGGASGLYKTASIHRENNVYGHWHSFGGLGYTATKKDVLFSMNCGCLIDVDSLAFAYGKTFPNKPTLGCGVILDGVPQFIPLIPSSTQQLHTPVQVKRGRGRPRKSPILGVS